MLPQPDVVAHTTANNILPPQASRRFKCTVLLVEDSPADVMLFQEALATFPHEVTLLLASDGLQGLHVLESRTDLCLVVLDLNLPRLSGLEVLQACHQKPRAPVIIFTSSSDPKEAKKATAFGARSFVQKPHNLDDFIATVHGLIKPFCLSEP